MELTPALALLAVAALAAIVVAGIAVARADAGRRKVARPGSGPGSGAALREDAAGPPSSDAQLLDLAEWLGVGLIRLDTERMVSAANAAAHRHLVRPPGSLARRSLMEAFVDHRIADLAREADARGAAEREFVFSGEPPPTLRVRARRAPDGGLWVALDDVSELRRLRRIRTEFVDNLSHELRTPLSSVRLLTESLSMEMERTEVPARVRDGVAKIEVETGHLVQMVNELLDLARIEQGEVALRRQEVDLGPVVESTLERLRLYGERQGVRLRADMPASPADRTVDGDAERIGQVLVNLVHNAVKFSHDGTEVVVRTRADGGEVRVEVEDQGVGIPRAELDRIFERFYKVDRARSRAGGGTGLGLAIARHVVERHGGRIWAERRDGSPGSVLVFTLPRARR